MISAKASKNKRSILLVDDEISILKLLEFVLQNDYNLIIKSNGFDALSWMDNGNIPDLIISDLEMPYFDGSDFLRAVKVSGYYRNIPIIVLSGSSKLEEIETQIPYNINGLVSKPFNPTLLKEKIKALLN